MTCIRHIFKLSLISSFRVVTRNHSVCKAVPENSPKKEFCINSFIAETDNSDYYFEDGLRKVYPYKYHHSTYCKGRWIGKTIVDAYCDEFAVFTQEEVERRITKGILKVNGNKVGLNYVLKNKDMITSDVHKHELDVLACPIEIIFENEDFFVVDKPPSIPVHPCGLYLKNSLLCILASEYNRKNLFMLHRLDRLTSGVMVFAKSSEKSKQLHEEMDIRSINKEYVCRVEGNFPDGTIICNKPIKQFHHKIGVSLVHGKGKIAVSEFKKMSFNGKSSVVFCKPLTGRTHQIRVHLQYLGYPIINDPVYNSFVFGSLKGKNGIVEKPIMELLEDLLEEHSSQWCFKNLKPRIVKPEKTKHLEFSIFKEYYNYNKTINKPNQEKDYSRITYNEDCYFCKSPFRNPVQDSLGLFLHAFKYEGEKWSFQSKMPFWASEDWSIA